MKMHKSRYRLISREIPRKLLWVYITRPSACSEQNIALESQLGTFVRDFLHFGCLGKEHEDPARERQEENLPGGDKKPGDCFIRNVTDDVWVFRGGVLQPAKASVSG